MGVGGGARHPPHSMLDIGPEAELVESGHQQTIRLQILGTQLGIVG